MARSRPHRNPTNKSGRRLRRRTSTPSSDPEARSRASRAARSARAGRMLVPSTLTILAICSGLTAVRSADAGQVDLAMGLLVLAAVFDGLDGRVARMMDASTKIGAEVDSLADAINFGVAPALIVYSVVLRDNAGSAAQDFGWVLALLFCVAVVLRLARFNTLLDDDSAPSYTKDYFVGVPAPAAAVMALLPIGLQQHFGHGWWVSVPAVGAWLLFIGFLAVSRIPTLSLKSVKIRPSSLAGLLFLVAAAGALLFTFPYLLMVIGVAAYLIHIPFAWRTQRWVAAHPEHWEAPARDRRLQRRDERRQAVADGTRRRVIPARSNARLGLRRPPARRED
ncbi:phosphatidylcholine/phosphatidylserine synthase [Gordonia sp. PS3]|uniref:Phosphatidylserine synthase n=1 Tax=Gordonia sihwensis NBRC 108236 TaxID=1223544 RepID=L7LKA2_9ACTN|nr:MULTISPECIES: phosphatidylcholine/phosphatidylserine synthase [Gordonia]AUH67179.1 phosphatidylcholine/phosphatidylserine synthase [Gordonia sp. YC-JH1]KXT58443.1 phosphatidylserine synthase [Gordonia sp. QH-12]GAC61560.1 phosphatidylserine synthase [Gordonia sihwensis NBRC 108236]